jgi:hypothetical protein
MSRAGEDRTAASPRRYSVESFVPRRPCLEKISGIEKDAFPMMVGGGGRCPRTLDCVDVLARVVLDNDGVARATYVFRPPSVRSTRHTGTLFIGFVGTFIFKCDQNI